MKDEVEINQTQIDRISMTEDEILSMLIKSKDQQVIDRFLNYEDKDNNEYTKARQTPDNQS